MLHVCIRIFDVMGNVGTFLGTKRPLSFDPNFLDKAKKATSSRIVMCEIMMSSHNLKGKLYMSTCQGAEHN